jgi:hypothetical protein
MSQDKNAFSKEIKDTRYDLIFAKKKSKSIHVTGPPVWSSGQSSWLQIQRSGFDSRRYQIFWEIVGLERGPLSLVNTIEKLLERKSGVSGLKSRDYGRRELSRWPRDNPLSTKVGANFSDKRQSLGRYSSFADNNNSNNFFKIRC